MNKKSAYQTPQTSVIVVRVQHHLLSASQIEVTSNTYNATTNGAIRSRRGGSLWDDDEE